MLALLSFQLVRVQQEIRWENQFHSHVEKASVFLRAKIEIARQSLVVCRSLINASSVVTRREFRVFTHPLLQTNPYLYALEWLPRVPHHQRVAFENSAKAEGLAGFRIQEKMTARTLIPARERAEYFPIYFAEPFSNNKSILGYDPGSDPTRRATLNAARDSGQARATEKIHLVQDRPDQAAVLIALPVYKSEITPPTPASRQDQLKGFVLGAFRVQDMFHKILDPFLIQDTDLAIVQGEESNPEDYLFGKLDPGKILKKRERLDFFGQEWKLIWQGGGKFAAGENPNLPYAVGGAVLFAVGLLAWGFETNLARVRIQTLFDTTVDGIITIDTHSRIRTFNPAAEKLFGYAKEEVIGKKVMLLMPSSYAPSHEAGIKRYLKTGEKRLIGNLVQVIGRKKDGTEFPIELGVSEIRMVGTRLFTAIVRDISAHKKLEKELEALSHTDGLTGINNRRFFDLELEKEWKRSTRDTQPLSLILLDIDNFKNFNDTYGHVQGDVCLKAVAKAINNCLHRAGDFLARYGGEEFVVLLPGVDLENAVTLAETIRRAVELLSIENRGSQASQFVTVSLGVATVQETQDKKNRVLVEAADKALYRAKNSGKNRTESIEI